MSSLLSSALDTLRGYAGSTAWGPLVRLSRTAILSLLNGIEVGCLIIKERDGTETRCGGGKGSHVCATPPRTELRVQREAFWLRLALFADMVRFATLTCVDHAADP